MAMQFVQAKRAATPNHLAAVAKEAQFKQDLAAAEQQRKAQMRSDAMGLGTTALSNVAPDVMAAYKGTQGANLISSGAATAADIGASSAALEGGLTAAEMGSLASAGTGAATGAAGAGAATGAAGGGGISAALGALGPVGWAGLAALALGVLSD